MSHGVKTAFVQKYPNTNLKQKNTLLFFLQKHRFNQQNQLKKHKKTHKTHHNNKRTLRKKTLLFSTSHPLEHKTSTKKLRKVKEPQHEYNPPPLSHPQKNTPPPPPVDKIIALQLSPLNVCAVAFGTPPRPFSAIGSACERHLHL